MRHPPKYSHCQHGLEPRITALYAQPVLNGRCHAQFQPAAMRSVDRDANPVRAAGRVGFEACARRRELLSSYESLASSAGALRKRDQRGHAERLGWWDLRVDRWADQRGTDTVAKALSCWRVRSNRIVA